MNLIDGNKVYGYLHIARDSLTMLETIDDFSIVDREEFTQLLAENGVSYVLTSNGSTV